MINALDIAIKRVILINLHIKTRSLLLTYPRCVKVRPRNIIATRLIRMLPRLYLGALGHFYPRTVALLKFNARKIIDGKPVNIQLAVLL